MERAAERFGISHHGLFADTTFIARTSGQRWADSAKRDGLHEGIRDGFLMASRAASGKSPFHHLKGVNLGPDQPATSSAHAMVRALVAISNDRRSQAFSDAELARQGGPEPPPEGMAKRIIAAGKKARGE
jgi:hypothetical protein